MLQGRLSMTYHPRLFLIWHSQRMLRIGNLCQVCCSSPERFLRGGRGKTLEAKPIKGTARRILGDAAADAVAAAALAASEKVSKMTATIARRYTICVKCLRRIAAL